MCVSKERLEEFRRLYEEEFGEPLTREEAEEVAGRLVALYLELLESLPSERKPSSREEPEQSEAR